MENNSEIDPTKLRYVLYARKSTIDKERQVRSIPDQIKDCQELAKSLGIHIRDEDILRESGSAKTPNRRPIFKKMIDDIKRHGKYGGILSWNPDRLARNMLEGGEIINLIDEGIIKDLKFKTHYFTNDANGKMLLGMAFVLSKQYSDDLSQKVTRGVKGNYLEGKTPHYKYGYYRDEQGFHQPDGENFKLIKKGWSMRAKDKASFKTIANTINDLGFRRVIKSSKKTVKLTPQMLTKMFEDTFYFGLLRQEGKDPIDLRKLYDFIPAVSEEDFFKVQELKHRRVNPYRTHTAQGFYPLKLIVKCSYCGDTCYIAPSTSGDKKTRLLYCRCDNKNCLRHDYNLKKSVRSKIVFDFIYKFLENGLGLTEKDYNEYENWLKTNIVSKNKEIEAEINSKRAKVKQNSSESTDLSLGLARMNAKGDVEDSIMKANKKRIKELEEDNKRLSSDVSELGEQLFDPERDKLSVENFLNLSKNAGEYVKAGDAYIKDKICRLIFLNIFIDDQRVTDFRLKEPFATLLKNRIMYDSRGYRIRTCNLMVPNHAR